MNKITFIQTIKSFENSLFIYKNNQIEKTIKTKK